MICPFSSDKSNLKPCVGSCQLNIAGSCAFTQIALQLNAISKKISNTNENNK